VEAVTLNRMLTECVPNPSQYVTGFDVVPSDFGQRFFAAQAERTGHVWFVFHAPALLMKMSPIDHMKGISENHRLQLQNYHTSTRQRSRNHQHMETHVYSWCIAPMHQGAFHDVDRSRLMS
jgi:hypothetical protein